MNNAGLVLIGILGIGILAKWSGRLTPNEGTALAVVVFNLTIPAASFMALVNVRLDQSALFLPLIALAAPLVLLLIAYLMELRTRTDADEQVRVGMSVLIFSASENLDTEFAATFIALSILIDLIIVIALFPLMSI